MYETDITYAHGLWLELLLRFCRMDLNLIETTEQKSKMKSTNLLHKIKYLLEHADDAEDLENAQVDYLLSADPDDKKSMLAVETATGKFTITIEEIKR